MPELSKVCDPFGDAMARGFYFGDAAPSSSSRGFHPDAPPHLLSGYPDYGAMMDKTVHHGHDDQAKGTGTSMHFSPFGDPDFFLGTNSFLPQESDIKLHPQPGSGGFSSPFSLNHSFPGPALEVPEIDSGWISEVLDEFSLQDLSAVPPGPSNPFSLISPVPFDFPPSIDPSPSLPALSGTSDMVLETSSIATPTSTAPSAPPPVPPASPTTPSITNTKRASSSTLPGQEEVVSAYTTPLALKPRNPRSMKAPKKPKKVANIGQGQQEHVERERQRRDDMSFKISTLESLLPAPGLMANLKRDRASIVHDSVHYVKSLQEQVEELKKKLSDLEHRKKSEIAVNRTASVIAREHNIAKSTEGGTDAKGGRFVEYHIEVVGESDPGAILEKCKCRPDYMSRAMRVFEELNLDVLRCTMTRMCLYTICVIVAKPRKSSSQAVTSSAVVAALRSSITVT